MKPLNDVMGFCCSVKSAFEITACVLAEYMQIGWFYLFGPIWTFLGTSAFPVFSRNILMFPFFFNTTQYDDKCNFLVWWACGHFGIVNS